MGRPVAQFGHQPVLDGVRGLAWLAVFLGHAGLAPELAAGQVAMFVFFGLSGFLITATLSAEHAKSRRISLQRFYGRRALRLVPALSAFLTIWLLVIVVFGGAAWVSAVPGSGGGSGGVPITVAIEGVVGAITYLTNWFGLFGVFTGYVPLGHLWSLAVEEQFYLCWPPLLALLIGYRRRAAAVVALLLAVASFMDVTWLHHAQSTTAWIFYGTDTRCGAFLVGSALGLLWCERETVTEWWRGMCTPVTVVCFGVLAWSSWVFDHTVSAAVYDAAWIGVSLAAPIMVVALIDRRATKSSWLSSPVMTYIGRRSYALYLWHYVWLTWLHGLGLWGVLLALLATLVCAELSWHLVEAPFLRMRSHFAVDQGRSRRTDRGSRGPDWRLTADHRESALHENAVGAYGR